MTWRQGKLFKMQKKILNKLDCMEKENEIREILLFFQAKDLFHKDYPVTIKFDLASCLVIK